MFMFDVETLGTESNSVVLSAAMIHFEFDKILSFQEYVDSACYVKFDHEEQISKGRIIEEDTVAWWKKQSEIARNAAFGSSSSTAVSSLEGIEKLRTYINDHGGPDQIFWMRGTLDQMAIDSLCKSVGVPVLTRFNKWRDVRTAIDILATDGKDGYCKIVGFDPDLYAIKHLPQHDCAVDILMLLSHE